MISFIKLLVQLLFKVKTVNFTKLRMNEKVIIMPNHTSFLDGLFLYLFLPKEAVFVINTERARQFAFFLRFVNHLTIDPLNPYSIRKIIGVVNENIPVVLFPEGRITTTRGLMKIYDGIGFVALKTGATIFPVVINGLEYSKFSRIKDKIKSRWFPSVELYVHDAVNLVVDRSKSIQLQKRDASDRILTIMQNAILCSRLKSNANLFDELLKAAKTYGWKTEILADLKQALSYKKVVLGSYLLGTLFEKNLKPDEDKVGVMLPTSAAHVITLFGLFYVNRTPAILNFSSGVQSILDSTETAQIKTILTSREFIEKAGLAPVVEKLSRTRTVLYLEDLKETVRLSDKIKALYNLISGRRPERSINNKLVLFTSGSESKPKGVVLKHDNILANVMQLSSVIDFHGKDKIFNALPMFHSFGLTAGTLLPVLTGVPVFMYPTPLHFKVIPEIVYDINATIIFGTPTFLQSYGKHAHPYDFYSVRYVFSGAEKLKEEVRSLWQEKFGIRILEGFGCTETAPVLSLNTPLCYRKGTVGRFLPGVECRIEKVDGIEDGGKLLVKGPNVMEGYLLNGKGFVPSEEWYDCGDVVSIDSDGYVTIKSRLKRFAKVGGEMISLNLVEELAMKCYNSGHQYVSLSLPDSKKGEKIVLVTKDKNASLQAFRDYLVKNMFSTLMCPSEILYVDEIPVLGSGKTDYVRIKELAVAYK